MASTDLSDGSSLYKSGGADVAVADGGTGASTAAGARNNLAAQARISITVGPTGDSGYVTDGIADDVQINAAISAVNAAGGGEVRLQLAQFNIAANVNLADNIELAGCGYGTVVNIPAGLTIKALNCSRAQIHDFQIDGTNQTSNNFGILIQNPNDVEVYRMWIHAYSFNIFINTTWTRHTTSIASTTTTTTLRDVATTTLLAAGRRVASAAAVGEAAESQALRHLA